MSTCCKCNELSYWLSRSSTTFFWWWKPWFQCTLPFSLWKYPLGIVEHPKGHLSVSEPRFLLDSYKKAQASLERDSLWFQLGDIIHTDYIAFKLYKRLSRGFCHSHLCSFQLLETLPSTEVGGISIIECNWWSCESSECHIDKLLLGVHQWRHNTSADRDINEATVLTIDMTDFPEEALGFLDKAVKPPSHWSKGVSHPDNSLLTCRI